MPHCQRERETDREMYRHRDMGAIRGGAMNDELRLLAAKESVPRSTIIGQEATSPTTTIHAAEDVTVVLTVAVDGARLARSVAIQWHHARKKTGTPSLGVWAEGVTTITYSFVADRPGTFTYHARYRRDRAGTIVNVRGSEAGPSAAGQGLAGQTVRVPHDHAGPSAGRRAHTAARHGAVNVPRSDRPASTAVRRAARGSRGMACVEAQIMGNCPVIYYDAAEYDEGPPVQRLLRRSGATLAAAVLWVSGICGPSHPD